MHLDLATLQAGLDEIRRSPTNDGKVELIVRRPAEDERETLTEARLDTTDGLVGDGWLGRGGDPAAQITVMNARSAALVAHSRERWPLAGDQLYVDLELGYDNLPAGTQLEVGTAVVEITDEPHTGCAKFAERFGMDAVRFVNSPAGREHNLRGVNARVVTGGVVRPGDRVRKGAHGGA